jgi:hypothetical protein
MTATLSIDAPPARRLTWRWVGLLLARLLMDAALIDAGVETWLAGSPVRLWVAAPIALYVVFTLWTLKQGSRLAAPGIVTQTPAAFYLFLGILVAVTQERAGLAAGVVMFRRSMPVILTATALVVTVLATLRMAIVRGRAPWFRIVILALGAYAAAALWLGVVRGTPLPDLLHGHSEWHRVPYWLQGAFLGAAVLTPLAFARELIVSMRVLELGGHLRWMVVFFLGAWIVFNAI